MNAVPEAEEFAIDLRAYADTTSPPPLRKQRPPLGPSNLSLIFDTETGTDPAQQLRVGAYQLRRTLRLTEKGLFYDPRSLTKDEIGVLSSYAEHHAQRLLTVREFVDVVVYGQAYDKRGTIVGANLPFDISRLAIGHASARKWTPPKKKKPHAKPDRSMLGGFTFKLTNDSARPRLQVRHLNRHTSLIRFVARPRQRQGGSEWRRRVAAPRPRRGYFCDVLSLGSALCGDSQSLASLALLRATRHQKSEAAHGQALSDEYLDYLTNDVQVTWECFRSLAEEYEGYGMPGTIVPKVYSEASIGKACLREMGVAQWRSLQPDFPKSLLGIIMSTYFGGRSEVHLRRAICRVLYCDFRAMYPTVSALMGLWRYVIARGVRWYDATAETRSFVEATTLADLARPETWRKLAVLVQVTPDADLFPVRAAYQPGQPHLSIGLNYLSADEPLWFTLADVLASKLLAGKTPRIVRALAFVPVGRQGYLRGIDIMGKAAYRIDPCTDDPYKRLVELRSAVKQAMAEANDSAEKARLDAEQQALKIIVNASCYGVFVELNVSEGGRAEPVSFYCHDGQRQSTRMASIEEPGRFFHPVVATLTTGGARLMLAIAERLTVEEGIDWAFCDTDSMALARPMGMVGEEFLARAQRVRGWFSSLDPYRDGADLFKAEKANYGLHCGDTHELEPLYCFGVSDKRYALFNLGADGRPVLRKASAHGLGHLLAPYGPDDAPTSIPAPIVKKRDLGVDRWQHDVWYRIVEAALDGHPAQVDLADLPGFDKPAASAYAATTPRLLRWFASFNKGRSYRAQLRPFGFMEVFLAKTPAQLIRLAIESGEHLRPISGQSRRAMQPDAPRAVATFAADPTEAARHAFDRETGEVVPPEYLKSYKQAMSRYHRHPEAKFCNGEPLDSGLTERRHVRVTGVVAIGKEANRWEEQFFLGEDPQAQIVYGQSSRDRERQRLEMRGEIERWGVRRLSRESELSLGLLSGIKNGTKKLSARSAQRLSCAIARLRAEQGNTSADGE